jgi:predicted phosphodiesterase
MLLIFIVLNSIFMGALFYLRLNKPYTKKVLGILYGVSALLSVILFGLSVGTVISLFFDENSGTIRNALAENLSKSIPIIAVTFLIAVYPHIRTKAKKLIAVFMLLCSAIWVINDFAPITPYKITSDPMVIDTGKDYSVVFSTNDYGTGYVEYTYEGKDYKVTDHTTGRLDCDSLIHSIQVPYEHLKNNTYKVGSTRVVEEFGYGSRLGAEVVSEEYTFTCNESDNQTYLVISDWHTLLDEAYTAIDYLGEYDAVILLGDAVPNVDYEKDVVKNIAEFGGKVSGGTMPVIYVRGNHETRGDYANNLPTALGLDVLYYTTDVGPYSFIVLDSGEDKEDSHREYGGLTDYGSYRAEMVEWLRTAEATNDKVIALSHAWEISQVEEELSLAAWNEIDRIGARLMISGHTHTCEILTPERSERANTIFTAHPDIIGFIDGGKVGENYIASKLTLTQEGFTVESVNNLGEEILKESFTW